MSGGCALLDHTADTGIRVWSETCDELFRFAALGMCSLIVDPALVKSSDYLVVEQYADTIEELLFQWLKELLFLINSNGIVFSSFFLRVDKIAGMNTNPYYIYSKGLYEGLDIERHEYCNEIKAVTRHLFKVERGKRDWKATIIFDL